MNGEALHDFPVDDPVLWQRPEHLAIQLGVTVRTLRKWVARGRAERTRNYQGQVYYRLTEPFGPAPSAVHPQSRSAAPAHEERFDQLSQQIALAQVEVTEFRARIDEATLKTESVRDENAQLRRELTYQRELASLPWWATRRRRQLTMPMVPFEGE